MAAFTEGFEDTRGSTDHFGAVVSKVMQSSPHGRPRETKSRSFSREEPD